MSGIEYLNLQTHRDLMRVCRDLERQARRLPREEALMVFRLCRPEIVAFTAGQKTPKSRLTQLHTDMKMAELLLNYDGPFVDLEGLEECRQILTDCIEFLHEFLKSADDYALWAKFGTCCHMMVDCCVQLNYQAQAETYCEVFHQACRNISRLLNGRVTLDIHLELIVQMYLDTERVFSYRRGPEMQIRACRAKMRRERLELWRIHHKREEKLQNMVSTYLKAANDVIDRRSPDTLKLAMELCEKTMDIIRNNPKLWGMRSDRIKCWITMGYIWELYDTEDACRKAKDCYVHAADAAKSYYIYCERTQSGSYDAEEYLKRSFTYIAEMYAKFPGEKNARKANHYRNLAGVQE